MVVRCRVRRAALPQRRGEEMSQRERSVLGAERTARETSQFGLRTLAHKALPAVARAQSIRRAPVPSALF